MTDLLPAPLEKYRTALEAVRRPAVKLVPAGSSAAAVQLGGVPLVPRGTQWPQFAGEPMRFVGHVELGLVHRQAGAAAQRLPEDGVLSLFVPGGRWQPRDGLQSGWALLHARRVAETERLAPPERPAVWARQRAAPPASGQSQPSTTSGQSPASPISRQSPTSGQPPASPSSSKSPASRAAEPASPQSSARPSSPLPLVRELLAAAVRGAARVSAAIFPPAPTLTGPLLRLAAQASSSLPVYGDVEAAADLPDEDEAAWDAYERLLPPKAEPDHRLLGYATWRAPDPRPPEDAGLRLVWQLDSDQRAGLRFGAGGKLLLFVEREDLAAGRFDRARLYFDAA